MSNFRFWALICSAVFSSPWEAMALGASAYNCPLIFPKYVIEEYLLYGHKKLIDYKNLKK
jgi:hypothetical protein